MPGHRAIPHTADITIEAWGPTTESCFAEAVAAMSETFALVAPHATPRELPCNVTGETDEELLVALLEEAIYQMDVSGAVPVSARIEPAGGGWLRCVLIVCDVADIVGAIPKAVTRHGLRVWHDGSQWQCSVTLDV